MDGPAAVDDMDMSSLTDEAIAAMSPEQLTASVQHLLAALRTSKHGSQPQHPPPTVADAALSAAAHPEQQQGNAAEQARPTAPAVLHPRRKGAPAADGHLDAHDAAGSGTSPGQRIYVDDEGREFLLDTSQTELGQVQSPLWLPQQALASCLSRYQIVCEW